jgi:hypothetical protein
MKRIISIIFLGLLVMKIGGYFAFLSIQQIILKEEAKERIIQTFSNRELAKLSFSNEEFAKIDWQEQDKEFYFQGKLYDIVRSEFKGKNHVLYCFSDEKETVIYDKILQISEKQNDELPLKNTMVSLLNILLLKYTLPEIFQFERKTFISVQIKHLLNFSVCYNSISLALSNPPPEV